MECVAPSSGRLDVFLTTCGAVRSRAQAQKLIVAGAVTVAGVVAVKPSHRVWEGNAVVIDDVVLHEERASQLQPVDLGLDVLFEDDACIAINKPAGVVVHPTLGVAKAEPTILHGAAHLFAERGLPFSEDGVLVHRLDRDTTGVLLLAKTKAAHAELQKQFADRTVRKTYLALVTGVPSPAAAVIDAPVGRHMGDKTRMAVRHATGAREARTTYRTIAAGDGCALLACDLHTGRTHQIRVHLSSIGHPVLGDGTYATAESRERSAALGIERICLHAWQLTFRSPADDAERRVEARFPAWCRPFRNALP